MIIVSPAVTHTHTLEKVATIYVQTVLWFVRERSVL